MSDESRDAYARGEAAGRILERLEGHDKHLARINGSIDEMTEALTGLTRVVAAQSAGQDTRDAQVAAAADALEADATSKADAVERKRADRADALAGKASWWLPWPVLVSVAALALTAAGLLVALI